MASARHADHSFAGKIPHLLIGQLRTTQLDGGHMLNLAFTPPQADEAAIASIKRSHLVGKMGLLTAAAVLIGAALTAGAQAAPLAFDYSAMDGSGVTFSFVLDSSPTPYYASDDTNEFLVSYIENGAHETDYVTFFDNLIDGGLQLF